MFSTSSRAMCVKNLGPKAVALLCLPLIAGCGKNESGNSSSSSNQKHAENEPVLSLRWIGMKRLSAEPSAAGFMRVWRLPESERLKAQTLDKLALAPWHILDTNSSPAVTNFAALVKQNHGAALLRPLLDDLVQNECYVEVRGAQPGASQLALAIRMDPARAGAWQSNLAGVFSSFSGARTVAPPGGTNAGWQIQFTSAGAPPTARQAQLTRAGEWTVLGVGTGQNAAFSGLLGRVQGGQPATAVANDWLQTVFDLRRLAQTLDWGWDLPEEWPKAVLNFTGDSTNTLMTGQLIFAKPLQFEIEKWNIPTNLIREPLHGFTAAQGLQRWISSVPFWKGLNVSSAPNQIFTWSQSPSPFLGYAASPMADAKNVMAKLGPKIMDSMNPTLAANRSGKWEHATNFDGIVWRAPVITPFVDSITLPEGRFLCVGLAPLGLTNGLPPAGTIKDLVTHTNVIYFDREVTGPRIEAWMFLSQLSRIIFRRGQMTSDACATAWLRSAGLLLGASRTTITKSNATTLYINRASTIGLTGLELHLLGDWLESPQFPRGLHSTIVKLPAFPARGTAIAPVKGPH